MAQLIIEKNKLGKAVSINKTNFGIEAENVINQYMKGDSNKITKTKIRGILDLVNKIYNRVVYLDNEELSEDLLSDIAYLQVKLAYECGRDEEIKIKGRLTGKYKEGVRDFIDQSGMRILLDQILKSKSKEDFLLYARYVESLIAYFKFHGGKD